MRKSVELEEADRHALSESSDALRAKPYSLNANDSLGKTIRFTLVPDLFFAKEWQNLSRPLSWLIMQANTVIWLGVNRSTLRGQILGLVWLVTSKA